MTHRVAPDLLVPDSLIRDQVSTGEVPARFSPVQFSRLRQLNDREIRAQLTKPPQLITDLLIKVIFDESGSVTGGNDAVGNRHELTLIALEHLVGARFRG